MFQSRNTPNAPNRLQTYRVAGTQQVSAILAGFVLPLLILIIFAFIVVTWVIRRLLTKNPSETAGS